MSEKTPQDFRRDPVATNNPAGDDLGPDFKVSQFPQPNVSPVPKLPDKRIDSKRDGRYFR